MFSVWWTKCSTLVALSSLAVAAVTNSSVSTSPATATGLAWLRSPQCTSSYSSYYSAHMTTSTSPVSATTVTVAAGSTEGYYRGAVITSITGPTTAVLPATYELFSDGPYDATACCGTCSIYWEMVQVRYFPVTGTNTDCLSLVDPNYQTSDVNAVSPTRTPDNTGNIPIPWFPTAASTTTSAASTSAPTPTITPAPLIRRDNNSVISIAVGDDGFTYTSPYVYVVFETISALDSCGARGGFYTSITWSYLPDQISTVEGRAGPTKSFDLADLPCPPAAVASADWYNYRPQEGAPYRPVIAPPPQLWKLDPLFVGCEVDIWEGLDPPHALTPQAQLAETSPAAPTTSIDPVTSIQDPALPITSPVNPGRTPESSLQADPSTVSQSPAQNDPAPSAQPDKTTNQAPQPDQPETTNIPSTVETNPAQSVSTPSTSPVAVISALPPSKPTSTTPITIGSITVSSQSSNIVIGSQTVRAGSVITIGSTTISVDPSASAIVVDGSSTIILSPPPTTATVSSYVAGGQTITSQAGGGFVVGGQTLTPGGSAVTISGTTLSLASGSIVIGSSTFALSSPAAPTAAGLITAGSLTFSPLPTGFAISGSTLLPGQAITVAGTVISISPDESSIVIGGSSTIALTKTTSTEGIGGAIWTAFVGPSSSATAGSSNNNITSVPVTGGGAAVAARGGMGRVAWGLLMGTAIAFGGAVLL